MAITLKIDNPEIEEKLRTFIKDYKEVTVDMLKKFFDSLETDTKITYKKKDPKKHSHKITYLDIDGEDLIDVKPYSHIEDSGQYIHELRRQKNRK